MITPAYNEEESIFDTVTSILNYRKKVDFDLDYVVSMMDQQIRQNKFWKIIVLMRLIS